MQKLIFILVILFLLIIVSFQNWHSRERILEFCYDLQHPQTEVMTLTELDAILAVFRRVPYRALENEYKDYTRSNTAKYKAILKDKNYYQIKQNDFFKFVVDDIRVYDLLPKDKYYQACLFDREKTYNWLISPKLLHKLLELVQALEKNGYDHKALTVVNGHRHPKYNEDIGGASKSRHLQGEAIDISVGDIDRNGVFEEDKDKAIVLDLLEREIIGPKGGIGRYPGGRSVHFDVRGYRARWDKM